MSDVRAVLPTLTWTGHKFESDLAIVIEGQGRIESVVGADKLDPATPRQHLNDTALLPGFVNAHSHAFQIGLRGLGETYSDDGEDFWSWREAMYRLVEDMDSERLHQLCVCAFSEMLAAGITTVGEFHYLHHQQADDHAFDRILIDAARETGIRLVLLNVYYRTGGIDTDLAGGQVRFRTPSPSAFWRAFDQLDKEFESPLITFGAAIHSIRAATPEECVEIAAEARQRGLVCHMHVEEQPKEIEDCRDAYGTGPLRLLLDEVVDDRFTAVHLTHSTPEELAEFFSHGGHACICPLTEGNLGDGLPALASGESPRLCLGTDSNARISIFEEMRWLEYGQRVRGGRRGVLRRGAETAPYLIDAATIGGANSLGTQAGAIQTGMWADFALVDLAHPSLSGWDPSTLPAMLVFGAGDQVLRGTWVGGVEVAGSDSPTATAR